MAITRRGFLGTLLAIAAAHGLPDLPLPLPVPSRLPVRDCGYRIGETIRIRIPQRFVVSAGMAYNPQDIVSVYRDVDAMQ